MTLNPSYRICGENLFAEHSISYNNLESYFYGFSLWRDDLCIAWERTLAFFSQYLVVPVPVLYIGLWDEKICQTLMNESTEKGTMEGYVVRTIKSFNINEFDKNVAKFVRANHVQTDEHWLNKPVVQNKLK